MTWFSYLKCSLQEKIEDPLSQTGSMTRQGRESYIWKEKASQMHFSIFSPVFHTPVKGVGFKISRSCWHILSCRCVLSCMPDCLTWNLLRTECCLFEKLFWHAHPSPCIIHSILIAFWGSGGFKIKLSSTDFYKLSFLWAINSFKWWTTLHT